MTIPSWSSFFTFADHGTTYRVDPTPTMIALSVAGAAVVLFVALVVVAWRRPGAFVVPIVPALLGVVAGSATFVALDHFATVKHPSIVPQTSVVFAQAVRMNHAAFAIGVGTAIGAVFVLALRTRGHAQLLPLVLPLLLAGVGLVRARHHATSIRDVGFLPYFDLPDGGVMHAGRDHDVPVRLMSHFSQKSLLLIFSQTVIEPSPFAADAYPTWNATRSVHVTAPAPGPVPLVARGSRGPVTFTTQLEGKAVPEIASPFFSLRVGNELRYRVRVATFEGRALFFVPLGGGGHEGELVLSVTGTREHAMVRTFVVEVRRGDERHEVEVVALDGEMRAFDAARERIGEPILGAIPELAIRRFEPCTFSIVRTGLAECQRGGNAADVPAAPIDAQTRARLARRGRDADVQALPDAFALAAPATFTRRKQDTPGTLITAFVTLMTAGIVIPPNGSETASYTLVATRPGPAGSPEAPPPR